MRRRPLLVLGALGLVAAGLVLRFATRSDLWFDEALSVNIAKLPLGDIVDQLRHDGHPPLYYFLLHFWIEAFGDGDVAVRALSGVLSVATLPLVWFAGRRIAGRAGAWSALLIVGLSPYAFRYATEARMYALVMLFVAAGYLALRNALETPTFGWLAFVAGITAGLVLTQYWDLYLVAIVGAGLLYRACRAPEASDRQAARRVFAAVAIGALAFAAWLPVFLDQIGSTGTPWGDPQFPWVVVPRALIAFAGSEYDGEAYMLAFLLLLLPLLALFGRAIDRRRIELDLRTRPAVRWEAATAFGVLVVGAAISYVTDTTFAPRYAATIFPVVALVVALGIMVFSDLRLRTAVLALIALLGLAGGARNVTYERTQAGRAAEVIAEESAPGDVVAYCSDQLGPDVSRLIRDVEGLEQITFPDAARPDFVNWSEYLERARAADPAAFAQDAITRAGDHTVWFVWSPGLNHLEVPCAKIGETLDAARSTEIRVFPDADVLEVRALTEYRAE
ncbi:MAG: hypothetical protein FJW86_08425 [Actinobacteria bacterium]|nr:hypothetical protein [Actinomycetota bacterium]